MGLMDYLAQDFVSRVLPDCSNALVLDAGCSYGRFLRLNPGKVIGLELQPQLLREGNVKFGVQGDATNSPFRDNTFDVVYSWGAAEHIPDQARFVLELTRITKPGGYVTITTSPWYSPHAGHRALKPFHVFPFPVARFLARHTRKMVEDGESLRDFRLYPITIRQLRRYMAKAGLKIERVGDAVLGLDFLAKVPLLNEVLVQHVYITGRKI